MTQEKIPFVDLHAQYLSIKPEIDEVIADTIRNSYFIRGPYVDKFEEQFASAIGVKHCVSCANGTDSLYITLFGLRVQAGDEIIVPAHSWISTSQTITQIGARVVFCDTDRDTFTLDPKQLEEKITTKTVGIIPVHLYGQAADMDQIMSIAKKHKLWVLEDCAQAHLGRYKGKSLGTFGHAASFSFYPGKNLGAMGDAGAVVTNDPELAARMTMFARHGGLKKGDHQIEGINSRMDGLQAAILSVKLKHLPKWTAARQQLAALYTENLQPVNGILTPTTHAEREHVWHLYVIRHENRDQLAAHLKVNGVDTVINYPVALPFLPAYKRFSHQASDFPNAYHNQSRVLSLPIYPELSQRSLERIVSLIKSFQTAR